MNDYDVIIVGGGLIGSALACALAPLPLKVAMIEARPYQQQRVASQDQRVTALSHTSIMIFKALGLWTHLQQYAEPIEHIHVSQQGHFGQVELHANDVNLTAFGQVVANDQFRQVLQQIIDQADNIDFIAPAKLLEFKVEPQQAIVEIEDKGQRRQLHTKLLVAADGSFSKTRQSAGFAVTKKQYPHHAIVANVGLDQAHQNYAYERFSQQGPIALLPWQQQMAMILTVPNDQAEHFLAASDSEFLTLLQQRFGYRLGRFQWLGARQAYPLMYLQAEQQTSERLVVIGNAAHTLHPIAAQGFNLGLRDCAWLAQLLAKACRTQQDIGDLTLLQQYMAMRTRDQQRLGKITDGLVNVFLTDWLPLTYLRNVGMLTIDCLSGLKKIIAQLGMGRVQTLPALALGMPIDEVAEL